MEQASPITFILVAITPENISNRQLALLLPLFEAGLDYLYIREPANQELIREYISKNLPVIYYNQLLLTPDLSSFLSIPRAVQHLKEAARNKKSPDVFNQNQLYSTSVHALPDLLELPPYFRLVFFSPLFPSISKVGYAPKEDLNSIKERLATIRTQVNFSGKIIGLGGVAANNIEAVKQAGFDGAALLGSVWQHSSPLQAFKAIKQALS